MDVAPFLYVGGMKILNAQQLREADAYTIKHEPIASIDLMERASNLFVDSFRSLFPTPEAVSVFCGTGNNGGDGLVIARLLHKAGWNVSVSLVKFSEQCSEDNVINQERLKECNLKLHVINSIEDFPDDTDIIIDALLGTGVKRPLEGFLRDVVRRINGSETLVCSVDLPSGLYTEGDCVEHIDSIIHADYTLSFQTPKVNFLLSDYSSVVGNWSVLDIGLSNEFIQEVDSKNYLVDSSIAKEVYKPRNPHSHKGTYGNAVIIAGSKGMIGAAVLSTKACMRSGAGLTTICVPECGYDILQTTVPEAMCAITGVSFFSEIPLFNKATAVGLGPGLGKATKTAEALQRFLLNSTVPLVLDADALNLISENALSIPEGSIVTPHIKEFDRLFGSCENASERLKLAQSKAKENNIYIVLKGRFTAIVCPDGNTYFNSTGNPGMATGGSGDVLTGILTSLLAQGYPQKETCILGCYLHGRSGDLAANDLSQHAMIASDIITYLSKAFQDVSEK